MKNKDAFIAKAWFGRKIFYLSAILIVSGLSAPIVSSQDTNERMEMERNLATRRCELDAAVGRANITRPRVPRLDSASREALKKMRRVDREDEIAHREFLKGDNTGIFKLFPDNGCVAKGVIRVGGDCSGFVPDSSYFSFRTDTYATSSQHDIGFYRDNFINKSFLTQTIMVSLGDEPIEKATLSHSTVKFLTDFLPSLTPAAAADSVSSFSRGVDSNGYHFADGLRAKNNTTYAMRKIEFKVGGHLRSANRAEMWRLSYLQNSERKDSIYIFRVIKKGDDGVVTILWKQIIRKDAPKIKFQKGDKFLDLASAMDKK